MSELTMDTKNWIEGQSAYHREIVVVDSRLARIEIKSDSIESQCYARVDLHDGQKWNHLYSIPAMEMYTPTDLAYKPKLKADPELIEDETIGDRTRLICMAQAMIGVLDQ